MELDLPAFFLDAGGCEPSGRLLCKILPWLDALRMLMSQHFGVFWSSENCIADLTST
jgi:hypothetical protein